MSSTGDFRLVQTAVVGQAKSRIPVTMPLNRKGALEVRDRYQRYGFWCGIWLGGCGRELTTRIGRERVPHFAHHPEMDGEPFRCQRSNNGLDSAEHLYVSHDIERWSKSQKRRAEAPFFGGTLERGGRCTGIWIPISGSSTAIAVVLDDGYASEIKSKEEMFLKSGGRICHLHGTGSRLKDQAVRRDG